MADEQDKPRVLLETNNNYAFAHYRVVTDNAGNPVDYIFIKVNRAFEEMTDLAGEEIIGRKITEVFPDIGKSDFDWIGTYGKVAPPIHPFYFTVYTPVKICWKK